MNSTTLIERPRELASSLVSAIAYVFHACRECGHAPVVRPNARGFLAFCNDRSCDKWAKVEGKTSEECWEKWERV